MLNHRNHDEANPLLALRRRNAGLRLAIAAAAIVTGATLVLSASLGEAPHSAPAKFEQTALSAEAQNRPARQVRVIPLWSAPNAKQGS